MSGLVRAIRPWIELTRLHQFAGLLLAFWPFIWSLTLNAQATKLPLTSYIRVSLYGFLWVLVLRSAGCIWNDFLDRNIDRRVERTKNRPLADGRITLFGALAFLAVLLSFLLKMMEVADPLTWRVGILGIFPLTGFYPLMKRVTNIPQAWLGVAMNVGVPLAWAGLHSKANHASIALGFSSWVWTMYYDTIYACQDMKDDKNAGVKSTALLFGSRIKWILSSFATLTVLSLVAVGVLNRHGLPYYVFSVFGSALHLVWQMRTIEPGNPENCGRLFQTNGTVFGAVVWSGFFMDYLSQQAPVQN